MPTDIALPTLQLPSGVPGLDNVLGGGIPERSCTVIVGGPGTGKTTLAQQILLELRRVERDDHVTHDVSVIKMRSSPHLAEARTYAIGRGGLRLVDTEPNPRRNGHALADRPVRLHLPEAASS